MKRGYAWNVEMNMRTVAPLVLVALIAAPVVAQQEEQPAPNPDYSRDTLIRMLSVDTRTREQKIEHQLGAIYFSAAGMRWRYSYLPFLAPLQGSRFNHVTTNSWPDPFALTGTEIAQTPRTYRRAMSAELKRINKITKESATVVVNP